MTPSRCSTVGSWSADGSSTPNQEACAREIDADDVIRKEIVADEAVRAGQLGVIDDVKIHRPNVELPKRQAWHGDDLIGYGRMQVFRGLLSDDAARCASVPYQD